MYSHFNSRPFLGPVER